jgi:hypothetical protein
MANMNIGSSTKGGGKSDNIPIAIECYFVFIYGSEGFGFSHFWMTLPVTTMMGVIQGSERWTKDLLHNVVYKVRRHMIWTICCYLVLRLCRSFCPFSFHLLYVSPSISHLKSQK